jgi:hypothetical protein
MGATEPHNLHLPYGTDTFEAESIGTRACEAAWNRGAKVILLPAIPYGTETNQAQCRLSMNLNPSTLARVIQDLVDSLEGHGIRNTADSEQSWRKRVQAAAARALRQDISPAVPVRLVSWTDGRRKG